MPPLVAILLATFLAGSALNCAGEVKEPPQHEVPKSEVKKSE